MSILFKVKIKCDLCGENYKHKSDKGGILFGNTFVCPECTIGFEGEIKKFKEEGLIRAKAIEGESFHAFIIRIKSFGFYTLN